MTREEFEDYKKALKERFVWCKTSAERKYLQDKGYRYLFRCTHYKNGKFFWVFDKSDAILQDMDEYKKSVMKESEVIAPK